jgi:hypothetical protein
MNSMEEVDIICCHGLETVNLQFDTAGSAADRPALLKTSAVEIVDNQPSGSSYHERCGAG